MLCWWRGFRGEDAFPPMLIRYLFLRVSRGLTVLWWATNERAHLTINFPGVIICCFGNNSVKGLNSHLASQWLRRVMGWRKEGIVTGLFTSYGPNTTVYQHCPPCTTCLQGAPSLVGDRGWKETGCHCDVYCGVDSVGGALGAKGGRWYRLKGSQKASWKKSPWWWPRQKKNVLGRRTDIFKDFEVKIFQK